MAKPGHATFMHAVIAIKVTDEQGEDQPAVVRLTESMIRRHAEPFGIKEDDLIAALIQAAEEGVAASRPFSSRDNPSREGGS